MVDLEEKGSTEQKGKLVDRANTQYQIGSILEKKYEGI